MVTYGDWELRVHEIKGKIERGELIPDPDWQRGYIWNRKDEQLLIDSIIREMPIPKFYLTEEYNAKKGVSIHFAVDGQQRLTALYKFLNNEFPISIEGKEHLFKDLNTTQQQKITTYTLNGHYLQDFTQADINFLFQRLNRTGIKLTNMEVWNNEFFGTNVMSMVNEIEQEHAAYYGKVVYTEENIKRMLPLDDIIDLCNCLSAGFVKGGGKAELESFLNNRKDITPSESSTLKSYFRKVINNLQIILPKTDLEVSLFSKRTHFISLFLSIGLLIPKYYILSDPNQLKSDLLDFIENQPDEYKDSVFGAIRQKSKRETRVELLKAVMLKYTKELDSNRYFDEGLKQKLWRHSKPKHLCRICGRGIRGYQDTTVDHKEPWSKGGKTIEDNAQLAHKSCNQKKRDKLEQLVIT
ncbi:HNH endonuclease family protein [Chloroflexota bacterium]